MLQGNEILVHVADVQEGRPFFPGMPCLNICHCRSLDISNRPPAALNEGELSFDGTLIICVIGSANGG